MRLPALVLAAALLLATPAPAQEAPYAMTAEVIKVLDDSAVAWSRGDLDGFMDSYQRGDAVTFIVRDGPVTGWQTIRDRYHRAYGGESPEAFGALRFEVISIRALTADDALVTGRYFLTRERRADDGVFTLLFRRGENGWRIVYDHTS